MKGNWGSPSHVKKRRQILPMCCYCGSIRSDDNFWQRMEDAIRKNPGADLCCRVCPECWEAVVQPEIEAMWGCKVPYKE